MAPPIRKDLPDSCTRRSNRERHAVYKSLSENTLGLAANSPLFQSLLNQANKARHQEYQEDEYEETSVRRYSTRSRRRLYEDFDDDSGPPTPRIKSDDEEVVVNRVLRKRPEKQDIADTQITEPNGDSLPATNSLNNLDKSERKIMRVQRQLGISMNEHVIKPRDAVSADSDEEDDERRQYMFRRHRNPVERFTVKNFEEHQRRSHRARSMEACNGYMNGSVSRSRRPMRRRRKSNRDSSSSTDFSGDDMQKISAEKDLINEARFERRKLLSMQKGRNRFLPINMNEKELKSSSLIKERLRQLGGTSCTDIDPMAIDQNIGFEQIGGLTQHLQALKEIVLFPLIYPEIFKKFNVTPPKGVLFYGPPGTGKTLVARALANECSRENRKVAFFMRKGADCLSKWVGESERQLRLLFDQAYSMRPSIIFFDEIDGLAPVRSSRQDQIHSSIVSTLLALMDGLDNRGEVIVIGATNRLDAIDSALRRPGRFDRELMFSLPDKHARQEILKIHTASWSDVKPDEETIGWIANETSGYCGADLKALCTESVLIALRLRYPHIYMTSDKLALNPDEIKIAKEHFQKAMTKIVPSCRRDFAISSRPMNPRLACFISPIVDFVMERKIPTGYLKIQNIDNLYKNDLEKVVRSLEVPPSVPAARMLLHGKGQMGQTHYILPVIIKQLDHLPIFSLACSQLFSLGNPEETLSTTLQAIVRSTSNGMPTLLLIPDIDVLEITLPTAVWKMITSAMHSFTGFTSVLLLASAQRSYEDCSDDIKQIFRHQTAVEIKAPSVDERKAYFMGIILEKAKIKPNVFDASNYPMPSKSAKEEPTRRLSKPELKELEKLYEQMLRQFRIFLRDMLARLIRDRRFHLFHLPVNTEDAADYYEIITNPMCLSQMMSKIDRQEYKTKQDFLNDIKLIMSNALEYNPDRNMEDKAIRHNAIGLMDMAQALFDMELDDDFVERMEETAKLITECKTGKPVSIENPNYHTQSAVKRKRQSVHFGRAAEEIEMEKICQKDLPKENNNLTEDLLKENNKDYVKAVDGKEVDKIDSPKACISPSRKKRKSDERGASSSFSLDDGTPQLILNEKALLQVIEKAVKQTKNWSIPDLECIGAELTQCIDLYAERWNREDLPEKLEKIINEFQL
uniref:Bromo domain-containing protein n=1 Tax=Acrobeloides nanus TaxID=290746 RepID=A0A914E6G2_9BILA